jgi:hypothetical protein
MMVQLIDVDNESGKKREEFDILSSFQMGWR